MDVQEAIKRAIQMEKDGHAFYIKAAAQTSSQMGQAVFEGLAQDELVHLDTFQKIFKDQVGSVEWEVLIRSSKKFANLPIFPKDLQQVQGANPDINEIDALRMAMDSEKEAIDYYSEIMGSVEDTEVRNILEEIIEQEKKHYWLLEEEFNHLGTTGYWYEMNFLGL